MERVTYEDLGPLVAALLAGATVAIPTDTVYGLACAAHDRAACARLLSAKGRSPAKPSAIVAGTVSGALTAVLPDLPAVARDRVRHLLPGPLTLVVPNPGHRYPWLCGDQPDRIGLRVPDLEPRLAAAIDRVPALLLTSANVAGAPPGGRVRGPRAGGGHRRRRRWTAAHARAACRPPWSTSSATSRRSSARGRSRSKRSARGCERATSGAERRTCRAVANAVRPSSARGHGVSVILVPFAYALLLLLPGIGLWRLLRRGRQPDPGLDLAGALATGLALQGVLLVAAFAVHLPVWSIAVTALAIGVAALAVGGLPPLADAARTHVPFLVLGLAAGLTGWRLWTLSGDAPYHVGRVRRLLALDRLDLSRMPELVDGSNHPGYYFPLPHAVVAETAWLTGASPTQAYRGAIIVLGLVATLLAGAVVFSLLHDRPLALAGAAIAVTAGLVGVREWSFVADPPSLATQLEWPALVLLSVAFWRERSPLRAGRCADAVRRARADAHHLPAVRPDRAGRRSASPGRCATGGCSGGRPSRWRQPSASRSSSTRSRCSGRRAARPSASAAASGCRTTSPSGSASTRSPT